VLTTRSFTSTVAAAVSRHHFRGGFGLLVLLVLAGIGYGVYRGVVASRKRRGTTTSSAEPHPGPHPAESGQLGPPSAPLEQAAPSSDRAVSPDRPALSVTPRPIRSSGDGWAVETYGLTKRFGPNIAVDDVELRVPRGSAFGYLGPNGAGKTTLIRTLLGLTKADSGTMNLLGIPVPRERSRALARVGAIVDEPRFHGHLSGRDNLRLLAAARGAGADERITPALERVGLANRADDKVTSYSMGMRQRLGVGACLLGDPELLILDEPMNGLDPAGMHEMRSMIQSLVREGRTVMLSSHLLDEVERTCDNVAIVDRGRVIRQGSIDELVRGANVVVQVGCSDPPAAARLIEEAGLSLGVAQDDAGLSVTLRAGAQKETVAEINRRIVEGGISVYSLQEVRASLEDWFLSVTSRLGARQ
jgi:ABC-2 type transport system ATP-binding protein